MLNRLISRPIVVVIVVFATLVQAIANYGASTETLKVTVLEGTVEPYIMSITTGSFTPTATISGISLPMNTQPCNGYVEFCSRSYGNITYVAAHNSPFVMQNNVAANQNLEVAEQLNDGIRMLQGQTHEYNGSLHYCHTTCDLLDSGPIEDYLVKVVDWLRKNPFEVISIIIGNGDFVDVEKFVEPLKNSGIADMAYIPSPDNTLQYYQWPTLGDLILQGKRVIIYMDYKADESRVPYILSEFRYMWETKFSPTDANFPCTIDRPSGMTEDGGMLYMANHNLNAELSVFSQTILIPDKVNLNRTNAVSGHGSLGLAAETCIASWHRPPTFLLVDFYDVGNGSVFEVAAKMNDVTYTNTCCSKPSTSAGVTLTRSALRLMVFFLAVVSFFEMGY
ncbi:PLC-like phosphodiesterase [Tirmania nivea]|nr:PLC-like phosphodiesterase [Tirmania nivea]